MTSLENCPGYANARVAEKEEARRKRWMRWSWTEVEAEPIAAPGSKPEAGINKQGNRVIQTVLPAISRMSVRIRPRAFYNLSYGRSELSVDSGPWAFGNSAQAYARTD